MKYNWSIIGHANELLQLENDLKFGNLAHGYLFCGPNCIGKSTVARKFAAILQCENDFCGSCATCVQVAAGSHADTTFLENDGGTIKIKDVKALVERVNMTGQSQRKIFIIENIERMTREAANAFLKALEEPPADTVFILTTNSVHLLLPTIVSRVRLLKFGALETSVMKEALMKKYGDFKGSFDDLEMFAGGKVGRAVALLENQELYQEYERIFGEVRGLLAAGGATARFQYIEKILAEKDPALVERLLFVLKALMRKQMIKGTRREAMADGLQRTCEAGELIERNVNSRLVLENLMLNL